MVLVRSDSLRTLAPRKAKWCVAVASAWDMVEKSVLERLADVIVAVSRVTNRWSVAFQSRVGTSGTGNDVERRVSSVVKRTSS
jgi:hypothetical protein